jgi:SAM-dependent methyltransferase
MSMSIVAELRSFHRRRIDIPVDAHALVLDIGSGDKPHWRADVLVERFPGAEHGAQRSGSAAARLDRPTFDADAEALPFADQSFDYVICSHVLEHVRHPDRVISEMMRVAPAGYIEVPEAASAKIVDFPSHVWWCRLEDETLVFTAKQQPYFDADIERYLNASGLRQPIARLLDRRLEHRVIEFAWRGHAAHRVQGAVSDELWAAAHASASPHRGGDALASRVATAVMTAPRRGQRRRKPVFFDEVVHPGARTGRNDVLEPRLYRVSAS